jgi:hypothetical protein
MLRESAQRGVANLRASAKIQDPQIFAPFCHLNDSAVCDELAITEIDELQCRATSTQSPQTSISYATATFQVQRLETRARTRGVPNGAPQPAQSIRIHQFTERYIQSLQSRMAARCNLAHCFVADLFAVGQVERLEGEKPSAHGGAHDIIHGCVRYVEMQQRVADCKRQGMQSHLGWGLPARQIEVRTLCAPLSDLMQVAWL